ncbi:MAG: DUF4105 domain-containing protein [Bdellovibrionota bacterium]
MKAGFVQHLKIILQIILIFSVSTPAFSYERKLYDPFYEEVKKRQEHAARAERIIKEQELKRFKIKKAKELNFVRADTKIFLENLKTKPIYGIELLTAGSNINEIASAFGHSTIRLIMGEDPLEDIVIGPEAFIDDPDVEMGKGMMGGYTIIPRIMTFMDFLIQYHRGEYRSITRTIIPTTDLMRRNLISAFLDLNNRPLSYGKNGYKFKTNNCASIVFKLLSRANIINGNDNGTGSEEIEKLSLLSMVPALAPYTAPLGILTADTPKLIVNSLYDILYATTIPGAYIPAADVFFDEMKKNGSWFLGKKSEKWTKEDISIFPKLSTRALYMLYVGPIKMRKPLREYVISLLEQREIDLYDVYKMTSYNQKLYEICEDTACAKEQFEIIRKNWTKAERFQTAAIWGVSTNKKYDLKKYFKFYDFTDGYLSPNQVYNQYMQNLFVADLGRK